MNSLIQIQEELHNAFSKLEFEEERHIYKVGSKLLPSVSGLVKKHHEPFDEKYWSPKTASKLGITVEEVLKLWEDKRVTSATSGTRVHLYGENYTKGIVVEPSCNQETAVKAFLDYVISSTRYLIVCTELQMFSKKYWYAGTCDLLLYDTETNSLVLVDYKTNESLDKQFGFLYPPFGYLASTPYNKYQLQLSYYQILLEEHLSLPITQRMIVWLKRDAEYEVRLTTDFTIQLKEYLDAA